METVERWLREEFGAPDSTVSLERGRLIEGVRRVRRRRRRITSVVATALTVVAGFGVAQLGLGRSGTPPIGADDAGIRTVLEPPEFVTRDRGYVLSSTCATASPDTDQAAPGCEIRLRMTDDAGRSWQDRPLPAIKSDGHQVLESFGPDTLVLHNEAQRWLTIDGGRTWNAVTNTAGQAATIPAGGKVAVTWSGTDEPDGLGVFGPDGSANRLALPADLTPAVGFHPRHAATDGSYWVPCVTAAKEPCVASSRDHGRTWRPIRVTAQPPFPKFEMNTVATLDGRTVIANVLYEGFDSGSEETGDAVVAQRLYRSTDGGTTWQEIPRPKGRSMGCQLLPNGDVIGDFDGKVFRVPAGGRAFEPMPGARSGVHAISRTGPWLYATADPEAELGSPSDRTLMSLDGATWTELRVR